MHIYFNAPYFKLISSLKYARNVITIQIFLCKSSFIRNLRDLKKSDLGTIQVWTSLLMKIWQGLLSP